MIDFTLKKYIELLNVIISKQYNFQTFKDYLKNPLNKTVILRHDVDLIPENALIIAGIENKLGIKSSYYFRIIPKSFNLEIMNQINQMHHEIGYHYEDVDIIKKKYNFNINNEEQKLELIKKSYDSFCNNLKIFNKNFEIKTICMHGSPISNIDNRIIWKKFNYKDLGIIGEPYFDLDYSDFFYLTDTGRAWNKRSSSIRDSVDCGFNINIKSTQHLINLFEENKMPNKIIINTHPQRWYNFGFSWTQELIFQNIKNMIKLLLKKQLTKL